MATRLVVVNNHSVAIDLLSKGPVLDAGCRGFKFARYFVDLGHPVVMLDPAPRVFSTDPTTINLFDRDPWAQFFPYALVGPGHPSKASLRMTDDPEARYVTMLPKENDPVIECVTVDEIMKRTGVVSWDLIKLNIEGSEYDVLGSWPGPIARQLVVSFHEHTDRKQGDAAIHRIIDHLAKWYVPIRHEFDERYCAGRNAWDSVFLLKELAC